MLAVLGRREDKYPSQMRAGISPIVMSSSAPDASDQGCRVIIVRYISGDDVENVADDAVE